MAVAQQKPERVRHISQSPASSLLPSLLEHAQRTVFGGKLAYALVERGASMSAISQYPGCLAFYWHSVWATARWVARRNRIVPDATAVVIRTRPDILVASNSPGLESVSSLQGLFAVSKRTQHVSWTGEASGVQGDVMLITSWGAYESDIAAPIEWSGRWSTDTSLRRILFDRGMLNGWGYGRSASNAAWEPWSQKCLEDCIDLPRTDSSFGRRVLLHSCMLSAAELPIRADVCHIAPPGQWLTANESAQMLPPPRRLCRTCKAVPLPDQAVVFTEIAPLCPVPPTARRGVFSRFGFVHFARSAHPLAVSEVGIALQRAASNGDTTPFSGSCLVSSRTRQLPVDSAVLNCTPERYMFTAPPSAVLERFCQGSGDSGSRALYCKSARAAQSQDSGVVVPTNPDFVL